MTHLSGNFVLFFFFFLKYQLAIKYSLWNHRLLKLLILNLKILYLQNCKCCCLQVINPCQKLPEVSQTPLASWQSCKGSENFFQYQLPMFFISGEHLFNSYRIVSKLLHKIHLCNTLNINTFKKFFKYILKIIFKNTFKYI